MGRDTVKYGLLHSVELRVSIALFVDGDGWGDKLALTNSICSEISFMELLGGKGRRSRQHLKMYLEG